MSSLLRSPRRPPPNTHTHHDSSNLSAVSSAQAKEHSHHADTILQSWLPLKVVLQTLKGSSPSTPPKGRLHNRGIQTWEQNALYIPELLRAFFRVCFVGEKAWGPVTRNSLRVEGAPPGQEAERPGQRRKAVGSGPELRAAARCQSSRCGTRLASSKSGGREGDASCWLP